MTIEEPASYQFEEIDISKKSNKKIWKVHTSNKMVKKKERKRKYVVLYDENKWKAKVKLRQANLQTLDINTILNDEQIDISKQKILKEITKKLEKKRF